MPVGMYNCAKPLTLDVTLESPSRASDSHHAVGDIGSVDFGRMTEPKPRSLESHHSLDERSLNDIISSGLSSPRPPRALETAKSSEALQMSVVYFREKPVGTIAALNPTEDSLNYNQERSSVTMADDNNAAPQEDRAGMSEAGPLGTAFEGGLPVAGNSHVEDGVGDERNLDRTLSDAPHLTRVDADFVTSLPVVDEGTWPFYQVLQLVVAYFPLMELLQAPRICKVLRENLKSEWFFNMRASLFPVENFFLCASSLHLEDGALRLQGYDMHRGTWMRLLLIPYSHEDKGLLMAADLGIVCLSTGSADGPKRFVVYNPVTKERRDLPPLIVQRHPVVLSVQVIAAENRYIVIAIGSDAPWGLVRKKIEVYDSVKKGWTAAPDVPESFALCKTQNGAVCKGSLYILGEVRRRGNFYGCFEAVLAFVVEKRKWNEKFWRLPSATCLKYCQLVECGGKIFLFSREMSGKVEIQHIYRLNFLDGGGHSWTSKVKHRIETKLKPEYTCVPFGEARLGIFKSTLEGSVMPESICEVYDITEDESEVTEASHSLSLPRFNGAVPVPTKNHLGFPLQLSYSTKC